MFGFDITRSPHPLALAILSPLFSGAVFLTGVAYFRSDSTAKVLAYPNLDHTAKLIIAILISYAVGLLLTATIAIPFVAIAYLAGTVAGAAFVAIKRRRSNAPADPSSQSTLRRAAEVALGPAVIPRSPEKNAADFPDRLASALGINPSIQPPGAEAQAPALPEEVRNRIRLEALNLLAADYEDQWRRIYKSLYQIQLRRRNPAEKMWFGVDPTLTTAAAILTWGWLSFPVPIRSTLQRLQPSQPWVPSSS